MAVTVPGSFPSRSLYEHLPGTAVDVPDAQDLIEGANWLMAKARRAHIADHFVERRYTGGGAGAPTATTAYRIIETNTSGYVLKLVYIVRLGHARSNGVDGVRLKYAIEAATTSASTGTVKIEAVWSGGTITTTQSIATGTSYYVLGPTTRMDGDEEILVKVYIDANAAIQAGSLTLHTFSCWEEALVAADLPTGQ